MAIIAQMLSAEAFSQLVMEEHLPTWEAGGHFYTGKRGKNGWEMYRTLSGRWDALPLSTGTLANPAAGAQFAVVTVPALKKYRLYGVNFTMTTSVAVAERWAHVVIASSGGLVDRAYSLPVAITASMTAIGVSFAAGATISQNVTGTNGHVRAALPSEGVEVPAGGTITVFVTNLQGADDIAVGYYVYKEVDTL